MIILIVMAFTISTICCISCISIRKSEVLTKMLEFLTLWQEFITFEKYDDDQIKLGFQRQFQLAKKLAEYFPDVEQRKTLKILDIAAGTGLAGIGLYKEDFKNLDAVGNNVLFWDF